MPGFFYGCGDPYSDPRMLVLAGTFPYWATSLVLECILTANRFHLIFC